MATLTETRNAPDIPALMALARRYTVGAPDDTARHQWTDYVCAVHCECNDHWYRMRDCKHINAWLIVRDLTGKEVSA